MDNNPNNAAAIAATNELKALFEIDNANRKGAWHHRLMTCLPHATFTGGEPQIIFNAAGFTYYNLELPRDDKNKSETQTTYTVPELIDTFLINEGVGVAIEAHDAKEVIDLSYGDVLGFHLFRTFATPERHSFQTDKPRAGLIREGAEIIINDVPVEILPPPTMSLLEAILAHVGVNEPTIKLISLPETLQNELAFSIDTKQFSETEQQALIEKLGWFLPRYYSYLVCDLRKVDLS